MSSNRNQALRNIVNGTFAAFDSIRAAGAIASAVESGRRPNRRDIEALGLSADSFKDMNLR